MDERRVKSVPLFASLGKRERRLLALSAEDVDVPAGKVLAAEGRFAHEFFVIEDGTAEVTQHGARIATLGPGDFFGEIGLVDDVRRTASVVATTPMRLIVLTSAGLTAVRRQSPEVADKIQRMIDSRLVADARR
jgi:CRP/FNR family cyclic AMP-dependent transcriptional regulator